MGCNCKGGKAKVINNLNSIDHLRIAEDVNNRIISKGDISTFSDFDWIEIFQAYSAVYPNSSVVPEKDEAVKKVVDAVEWMKVKYNRK